MAETLLAATTAPALAKWSTTGTVLTMTAADIVNNNKITARRHLLVVVHNTDAGSQTITITSQADTQHGRTGNVSALSLAAGQYRVFELTTEGWANASNVILPIVCSSANIKIGVYEIEQ